MWMEFVVVFLSPSLDLSSRILEISKHVLIQTFVSEARVEGLDEGILVRLTRRDEVVVEADGLDPGPECIRLEFGAVIRAQSLGENSTTTEKFADILATDRVIDRDPYTLLGEIIDDGQTLELSICHQPIMHEIHGPDFVRATGGRAHDLRDSAEFLSFTFLHLRAHFSVNSRSTLVIDWDPLFADPVLNTR